MKELEWSDIVKLIEVIENYARKNKEKLGISLLPIPRIVPFLNRLDDNTKTELVDLINSTVKIIMWEGVEI